MSNNFNLPVNYGTLWLPSKNQNHKPKTEKLIKDLQKMDTAEEPLYSTSKGQRFSVEDIFFEDGSIDMMIEASEISIGVSMPVTPSKDFINFIDQINKSLGRDLQARSKEYKADDRGRISLGTEYSNQDVKVIVLDG